MEDRIILLDLGARYSSVEIIQYRNEVPEEARNGESLAFLLLSGHPLAEVDIIRELPKVFIINRGEFLGERCDFGLQRRDPRGVLFVGQSLDDELVALGGRRRLGFAGRFHRRR